MKIAHSFPLALALFVVGASSWAAQHDKHDGHHPAGAASAPAARAVPGKSGASMARMDTQMKSMREMHDKMMAAKTPEERNALMATHKTAMEDGMKLMGEMAPGDIAGGGSMKGDMGARHQMMEKRMEMMQTMMQMMMDRMPAAPAR